MTEELRISKYEFWEGRIERAEREIEVAEKQLGKIAIEGQLPLFLSYRSSWKPIEPHSIDN